MEYKRFFGTLLLAAAGAAMFEPASVNAQSAADMEWLWCTRMQASIMRNYQAVERMRARHQAGINRLRAEHQVPATRNLEQWYWKKVEALFQQRRALEAECNWTNIRRDAPPAGRLAPLPQPIEPVRPRRPAPDSQRPWEYPPYERYPESQDPFSPGLRR
jgi:hypothetical protein